MPGCSGSLWAHAVALFAWGLLAGHPLWHAAVDAGPIAVCAAIAARRRFSRRSRAVAVCVGLLTSSAVVVHLMNGAIEGHFHFFVMVSVLALYEEWFPYLLAFAFVLGHHGLMGALDAGLGLQPPRRHRAPVALGGRPRALHRRAGHRQRRALAAQRGRARRRDAQPRALPPRLRRRADRHGPHRPRRRRPARQRRALRAPRRRPGRPAAGRPRRRRTTSAAARSPPDGGEIELRYADDARAWGLWHHSLLTGARRRVRRRGSATASTSPSARTPRSELVLAGPPRRADRPAQPRRCSSSASSGSLARTRRPRSPCCSSTSTTSRSSTTRSATAPATACSAASPSGCAASLRPSDVIARFGGDEFTVLLPGIAERGLRARRVARAPGRARCASRWSARRRAPLRHAPASASQLQRAGERRPRGAAARRRRRDVPRQGAGQGALRGLRRLDARARARAPRARERPAPRARATASCASSTSRWSTLDDGPRRRRRGAAALGAPERGVVAPLRFIPLAEQQRPDRPDRRVGAARGVPPAAPRGAHDAAQRVGQRLGRASSARPTSSTSSRAALERHRASSRRRCAWRSPRRR